MNRPKSNKDKKRKSQKKFVVIEDEECELIEDIDIDI